MTTDIKKVIVKATNIRSESSTSFLRMRIDEDLKEQAEIALRDMGLDVADAVKVFLRRVVAERKMPFDIYAVVTPMEKTRRAMMESRAIIHSKSARFGGAQEFIDDLEKRSAFQ
ncbi:type II toxin-antitoxin system RelB/DinJ family antitoxin [Delftia sp. WSY_22]|uniref:type II toxin-antitoxin system RelB/DinJ family antitoxin n=1 Tax=Delftia sp. WSY_22 TaxID=3367213 RepID=UPI00370B44EA